ncbi:MAG: hypothetical protein JW991_01770 [Candidatus Pacebacteria bacterium]|nr:hypothetical protein [Candidatus Paceibacterota bacterium]
MKPAIKNYLIIIFPVLLIVLIVFSLIRFRARENQSELLNLQISNFEECAIAGCPIEESRPRRCTGPDGQSFIEEADQFVGDDRDEHGCIGSAGYAWCEPKQKCLRFWEEPCGHEAVFDISK